MKNDNATRAIEEERHNELNIYIYMMCACVEGRAYYLLEASCESGTVQRTFF